MLSFSDESLSLILLIHAGIVRQRTGVGHFSSILGERGPVIKHQRCLQVVVLINSPVDAEFFCGPRFRVTRPTVTF